jgi:hypothetical protein
MVGLRVEYPVIRTVEGKVVGMCLDADSPYLHAMVAAPEMLEALKALIAYQADNETEYLGMQQIVAYQRAKAAIAKAEGRVQE